MSEATATATAIPREINLGLQKPVATPAYTRRFKSQASTPTVNNGSQVTITLDTAQPGSFIDTLSSYLSFKLKLKNSSTTSGYNVSFSACGAHALFRAMRIYVQGVPIEEITEYNALAEWLHDLAGIPDYNDRSAKSRYFANTMFDEQTIYLPPKNGSTDTERIMNIQLPLLSGVLGSMADKMFPSMLVAPGNCYIQLDVSTASHALRVQEVDLTGMIVATAPVRDATNFGNIVQPLMTTETVPVSAINDAIATTSGYLQALGAATGCVDGSVILENGPFDIPFMSGSNASGSQQYGVLTTEERIGGGMFYSTGSYAAAPGLKVPTVLASADVADATTAADSASTTSIVTKSTLSNVPDDAAEKLWLGGGMTAAGAAANGKATSRLTQSSSIGVSFEINDLEYVGKQVVVGDDVARAIIERAASGDISIHTQSYRQYPNTITVSNWSYQVDPAYSNFTELTPKDGYPLCNLFQRRGIAGSQSLIIPAKISSANAIYCIYRNAASENNFWFDSLRRMTIGMKDQVGQGTAVTAQLRIGNELIPQSPVQSASEALEELLKAHHMNGAYGTGEKMGSVVCSAAQSVWNKTTGYQAIRFNTAVGPQGPGTIARLPGFDTDRADPQGGLLYSRNDWNSQILCPNPASVSFKFPTFADYDLATTTTLSAGGNSFFNPLGITDASVVNDAAYLFYQKTSTGRQSYKVFSSKSNVVDLATPPVASGTGTLVTALLPESGLDYGDRQVRWKNAVRRAFFGYADDRSDHQIVDPSKPNFLNPFKQHTGRYSTFMLGFDLDTFSHNSDTVRSGHYLGNNTVSLNLSEFEIIDNTPLNMPLCNSVKMDTFILHDLRLSFQAGGIVQAFY